MIKYTVGELRALIADLPDNMPVRGMDDEVLVMFVANYEDLPEDNRPEPTLVIEV